MEIINSKENKKVKILMALKKAGRRKKENVIVIEGQKEISLAMEAGVEFLEFYLCKELAGETSFDFKTSYLSKVIFNEISYRENPDGFLALAKRPESGREKIKLSKDPLVLVLESVEKPGNIGAMLRTADAVGADLLILCDPKTDLYNPNVIRASLGTVFTVPTLVGTNQEALEYLQKNKINIYSAGLTASVNFRKPNYKKASAVVIGTEHEGLSDFWLKNSDQNIKIPMNGKIDSLNASVSAAIILYEVERQRRP